MYTNQDGSVNEKRVITHIVVGVIALVIAFTSLGTVKAGYKGVRTNFGAVMGSVDTGLYLKVPFVQKVVKMNVQTQKEQVEAQAASKDLQNVSAVVALNYNLFPDKVTDLYSRIGNEYKTRIIDPAIQEAVKAATAKYTAEELITKRPEVRDIMKAELTERLANEYIHVSEVSIVNFDFSSSFNQAIEAKVTAEQNALAAKNKLEQVKYEAQQQIETAKASAEAIKIQAQAINSQGGADYVELQRIKTWDGKGCTQYCGLEASTGLLIQK